jgi:hypothetical protein
MKNTFRKITSAIASAVMIGSTVALAAAANYPAPFVENGVADVAIVYGTNSAAQTDLVAVSDVTINLGSALASQTATGVSTTEATVTGGDFVELAKSTDNLNLGNTMSGVFGATVDDDDLATLLIDGTYLNDENSEFDFEQKITLAPLTMTNFADNDYNNKEPSIGFHIASNTFVMNYTLDFTTDAESDVDANLDLVDLETTDLVLLGKTYYVSDWDNATTGTITLLDSANSGLVNEGETTSITVGDTTYDVSISSLTTSNVKLTINGELTNSLAAGESYKLSDGTYVGIKEIFQRDVAGVVGNVEFSLGTGKLEIVSGSDIELNDDTISGVKGYVTRGTHASGKEKISKVVIEWKTDDEAFITADQDLLMPGFEAVKFSMGSFIIPKEETISVDYDGDDSIEITVPIKDGDANFNILYANTSGEFIGIGKDADELLKTSASTELIFNESVDEWFVASYNTSSDSESYLLSLKVDRKDNKNKTTFKNEVTDQEVCKDKSADDTCDIGDVSLTINEVYKIGSEEWVNLTITSGSFNTIYTKEGLRIYLPTEGAAYTTTAGEIDTATTNNTNVGYSRASYYLFMTEEDKDDDIAAGTRFNITLNDDADGDVHITEIDTGQTAHEVLGTDDDTISYVQSDLATKIEKKVAADKGKAIVTYHGSEAYGEVFVTAIGVTITPGAVSGVADLGTVSVMDTEVASVATKNLIVVGGSCVNSVAADLLGSATFMCGADWEASTGVGAGQFLIETFARSGGKVATLVAGYNAGDTTNAAQYLTTQTIDTTAGKKYLGSSATSAALVTE